MCVMTGNNVFQLVTATPRAQCRQAFCRVTQWTERARVFPTLWAGSVINARKDIGTLRVETVSIGNITDVSVDINGLRVHIHKAPEVKI